MMMMSSYYNTAIILDAAQSSNDGQCSNNYHVYNKYKYILKIKKVIKTMWDADILTRDKLWVYM